VAKERGHFTIIPQFNNSQLLSLNSDIQRTNRKLRVEVIWVKVVLRKVLFSLFLEEVNIPTFQIFQDRNADNLINVLGINVD